MKGQSYSSNSRQKLPLKFPLYYAIGAITLSLLYVAYANAGVFLSARDANRSLAASTTLTYGASQTFNQFGTTAEENSSVAWLGSDKEAYFALQFTGLTVPADSTLTNAYIEVIPNNSQWISTDAIFYGEKNPNPTIFSNSAMPSSRIRTSSSITMSENSNWIKDNTYKLPAITSIVSELLSSGSTSTINFIAQGNGGKYGRKFIYGSNSDKRPKLVLEFSTAVVAPTATPVIKTASPAPTVTPSKVASATPIPTTGQTTITSVKTPSPSPASATGTTMSMDGESMAMMAWRVGGKNPPNLQYDKCDDGTDIVKAHNMYYVIAYDGLKYPTWHPPVVTNPVTGNGKCYFGHEHGSNPQNYIYWNEVVQNFGKDLNNDGVITKMTISSTGAISPGDRAGIPFGIANEHMDMYYNQEGRDSLFVRHEDHVGHKIEFVNSESEMQGNSTHVMAQLAGTTGINIPYYKSGSNTYQPTGVSCAHLHKFHQGTNSPDAIRNNLHETIFHSRCTSVNVNNINAPAYYPNNFVMLTGMTAFGKPGEYQRFCFNNRTTDVCVDGKNADGSCVINDPLISKLPKAINSQSIGRNMVDKYCYDNFKTLNPGVNYFNPYEIWEGDFGIFNASGKMLVEHGRQWDVLDPVRYVDMSKPVEMGYNQDRCNAGLPFAGNCDRGVKGAAWNSPQAAFKGLHRTSYFGRNRISNTGGATVWYTDPIGRNATTTPFTSGLKQQFSSVEADIQKIQSRVQKMYGGDNFLNDRAIQRYFGDGNAASIHAPN